MLHLLLGTVKNDEYHVTHASLNRQAVDARYGNEIQLVRIILRILILSINRQKNLRALETDAQIQLQLLVRELLSSSIHRLKLRHQHLSVMQISSFLSSYAAVWLPEYQEIFEVFASDLVVRINRIRRKQNIGIETEMAENLPYILASYGNAACVHPALFETSLSWCEENMDVILDLLSWRQISITLRYQYMM